MSKIKLVLRSMFSRKWIVLTLLTFTAAALFVRLGIWQLDRLEQRRAFNQRVLAQIDQPTFEMSPSNLNEDFFNMEYRQVKVTGKYDFENEIAIRNQVSGNQPGVHLVTPLIINGSDQAILVDRGWIPDQDFKSGDWSKYSEPGNVTVFGVFRRTRTEPDFGKRTDPTPIPGGEKLKAWFFVNVSAISQQAPFPVIQGAYIQQKPSEDWNGLPIRSEAEVEITEGPHMSYALQWFAFATIALIGYPIIIIRQYKTSEGI